MKNILFALTLATLVGCSVTTPELLKKGPEAQFTSAHPVKPVAECIRTNLTGMKAEQIDKGVRLSVVIDNGIHGMSTYFLADITALEKGGSKVLFYPGRSSGDGFLSSSIRTQHKGFIQRCVDNPGLVDIPNI